MIFTHSDSTIHWSKVHNRVFAETGAMAVSIYSFFIHGLQLQQCLGNRALSDAKKATPEISPQACSKAVEKGKSLMLGALD